MLQSNIMTSEHSSFSNGIVSSYSNVDDLLDQVGMNFTYLKAPAYYRIDDKFIPKKDRVMIYREDDPKKGFEYVGKNFKLVQPRHIAETIDHLCQLGDHFKFSGMGYVNNGARIWATVELDHEIRIMGQDHMKTYLFFATGIDGTISTIGDLMTDRIACNNQLNAAIGGALSTDSWRIKIPHSTDVDWDKIKEDIKQIPDRIHDFEIAAEKMADREVDKEDLFEFFSKVYDFEKGQGKRTIKTLVEAYSNGPGSNLKSSEGTLWGAINAVTHYEDHLKNSRSEDNLFKTAMMGSGKVRKEKAWKEASNILKLAS